MHNYGFTLDLSNDIDIEGSTFKVLDNKVDFTLAKKEHAWWSRLTAQIQKPVWLKVDFDRWQSEDDLIENDARDIRDDYPDLYDQLQKDEVGYKKEDVQKVYLLLYNIICYCGFLYVVSILGILYLKDGVQAFPAAYKSVGGVMTTLIILQGAEIFHCLYGLTKSGVFTAILQVAGRSLVLFMLVTPEPRIQEHPIVYYLFMVWSTVEIVRYPYYITQIYKKENRWLTWLRYSIWIPLYPLGFYCEAVIIYKSVTFLDETGRFSVSLPNALNFTFSFATFLRMYLLLFLVPGGYTLMSHMYKARLKKLSKVKSITKVQ